MKIIRTSTVPISLNILLKGQLKYLSQFFEILAVSGVGPDLKTVEQRERVSTAAVEMQRNISPVNDLISLLKLYFLFRKEKPQIVHSITPKAGLLSMLAAKMAGVPIRMHTFTGLIFPTRTGLMQKLLIYMDRLLCKAATDIYPEGNGVRNDLIQYKITKKPLKVLANGNINGIDVNFFSPNAVSNIEKEKLRESLKIKASDFVYVFVGRLVKDKGINELVQAFESISNSEKNIKLLLVGPFEDDLDPLEENTRNTIKTNDGILSVGFQESVREYFSVADALVFPSYREGFPNVVIQAGAMGLPAIVTDINGSNEIIEDGVNGIIIPVKNSAILAEQMRRLKTDSELYERLRSHARDKVVSRYENQVVWNALLDEYKVLLKKHNLDV